MYCSNCGQTLNGNLNYCNSCGTRVERSALVVSNSSQRPFAIAAIVIGGGGLFGFIPVLKILLESRLDQPAVLLLMIAYLVAVFLMFSVLIGHVWKNSGDIRIKNDKLRDEFAPAHHQESFRPVNTAQLTGPRQQPASVTDHTTRTLDHIPAAKR
ncbi:MAG: hypothetical protein ABJA02_05865 [Acidobacteriota bacterium]